MRKYPVSTQNSAFTLIEVITAMTIIVVLTSLVLGIAGYANRIASQKRAAGEIAMLSAACENYKAETGGYPQDYKTEAYTGSTEKLSPKQHFDPTAAVYTNAGKFFYQELTGDKDTNGVPDKDEQVYLKEYDAKILKADRGGTNNRIIRVYYFQDPFGYPYGYSTAGLRGELEFQKALRQNSKTAKRDTGNDLKGFSAGSYDLWSTGGNKKSVSAGGTDLEKGNEWAKWIKNW